MLICQALESLLPTRPVPMDIPEESDNTKHVTLCEYKVDRERETTAHDEEEDDEERGGHGGHPGVQCATQ